MGCAKDHLVTEAPSLLGPVRVLTSLKVHEEATDPVITDAVAVTGASHDVDVEAFRGAEKFKLKFVVLENGVEVEVLFKDNLCADCAEEGGHKGAT